MKILVTGSTGFIGKETVRQLAGAGHTLRLLVRRAGGAHFLEIAGESHAEICSGDVMVPGSLDECSRGTDAVVHLVGIISEARQITFENLHIRATRNVVEAAVRNGVRRFVHMSALGTRPNAVARYHQTKWAAEEVVRAAPLEWTIFRPSLVYGPEDHFVNLFARIIGLSPVVPLIGSPLTQFQPVSVHTVAAAFTRSLEHPASIGQSFDLVGPETFTLGQILRTIEQVLGRKRVYVQIPSALSRLQASLLELVWGRLMGKPPPLNRDQLRMLAEDNTGDFATATNLFGLRHSTLREGISAYLKRSS